jgi:hypothetical protein
MAVQSTTSTSSIDPALLPFLTQGLERAQSLFLTGEQPTFFPGQTFVSPSAATTESIAQQEAIARQQSPLLQQAQNAFMGGLSATSAASPLFQNIYGQAQVQPGTDVYSQAAQGGFQNVASGQLANIAGGSFLNANPYQQQMIQAATRPLEQQFSQSVLPGISSLYSKSGRLGSGSMERALGTATEGFGRALGDVTANIAGTQFQAERGLQQQALGQLAGLSQQDIANRFAGAAGLQGAQQAGLGTQLQAAGGLASTQSTDLARQLQASLAAPQIFGQQFLPSQALGQVGAQQEAIAGQPLQEQLARFQFGQQLPYQQLQGYLSSVYGSPMGSYGTQTQQTPLYQNRTTGALGGALAGGLGGYALGQAFPAIGGALGSSYAAPLIGAVGGGLLGGLF